MLCFLKDPVVTSSVLSSISSLFPLIGSSLDVIPSVLDRVCNIHYLFSTVNWLVAVVNWSETHYLLSSVSFLLRPAWIIDNMTEGIWPELQECCRWKSKLTGVIVKLLSGKVHECQKVFYLLWTELLYVYVAITGVCTDPGKVWKVIEFKVEIFQVWKIWKITGMEK